MEAAGEAVAPQFSSLVRAETRRFSSILAFVGLAAIAASAIASPPQVVVKEGVAAGPAINASIATLQTIAMSDGQTLSVSAKLSNGQTGIWTSAMPATGWTGGWKTPLISDTLPNQARGGIWEVSGSGSNGRTSFSAGLFNHPMGESVPGMIDSAWFVNNTSNFATGSVLLGMRGQALPVPFSNYWYSLSQVQMSSGGLATWLGTTSTTSDGLPSKWGIYQFGLDSQQNLALLLLLGGGDTANGNSQTYLIDGLNWPRAYRMSATGSHVAAVCSVMDGTVSRRAVVTRSMSDSTIHLAAMVSKPVSSAAGSPKWKDILFAIPSDVNPCTGSGKTLIVGKIAATQFDDSVVVVNGEIVLREGQTLAAGSTNWVLQGNVFDASMNAQGDWAAVWQVHNAANEAVVSTALILNGAIVLMPGAIAFDGFESDPLNQHPPIGPLTADLEVAARVPGDPVPVYVIAKIGTGRAVLLISEGPSANLCCAADFNHDNVADFFDYLDFVDAFANEDPSADFNGDSVIDFFDYLDFVDATAVGC